MDNIITTYEWEKVPKFRFMQENVEDDYGLQETLYVFENFAFLIDSNSIGIYYRSNTKGPYLFGYNKIRQIAYIEKFSMIHSGSLGNLTVNNQYNESKQVKESLEMFLLRLVKNYKVEPNLTSALSFIKYTVEYNKRYAMNRSYDPVNEPITKLFLAPRYSSMILYLSNTEKYLEYIKYHFANETWKVYEKLGKPTEADKIKAFKKIFRFTKPGINSLNES